MALQQRKILFEDEYFPHYFLCNYIPKAAGSDRLSRSLLSFKEGHALHRKAWTDCAVAELKKIPELQGSLIVRALSHDELVVQEHSQRSLDHLGVKISHALHGSYKPECLQKNKATRKLTALSKAERTTEVYKAHRFNIPEIKPRKVLIVDDILTSGATTCSIIQAILTVLPSANVAVFTLAHTDYDAMLNATVELKARPYSWQPDTGWMKVAEDSPQYAEALEVLKQHIQRDSFV